MTDTLSSTSDTGAAPLLHQLFEASVDRAPNAVAISSRDVTLSYRALDERANRLAHTLRRRGVSTGALVGLYAERSPDTIVAILALLKAGAAYVPLDPSHPPERIARLLADARISTLVTDQPPNTDGQLFGRDIIPLQEPRVWAAASAERISAESIGLCPDGLCYVLFTSGSTGQPKGVMTEHRNVAAFVAAFNQILKLNAADRVYQGFALGFDGSVEEMWMAFSNGCTLVVPERGAPKFGDELAERLESSGVSVYSTVPTSLSLISRSLDSVRLLIVSGERCSPETVTRWGTEQRRLLNVYGPTETTVNATAALCRPGRPVSIGRPLPGYRTWILNEQLQAVAHDETGELYIGGPGVARGYLNQPELTARQFFALPEGSPAPGERVYRTGDLVSLDASGELLFHGRTDAQLKIRGFRIEPSEIEAVLREDGSLLSAVVHATESESGRELAAYVVPRNAAVPVDRSALLAACQTRLPSHMVPAFLEELQELPLLPSGKLDRGRLPRARTPFVNGKRQLVAPRTPLEEQLVQSVAALVGHSSISITDDFFRDLGGYSLLAAQLASALRTRSLVDLSLRDIYERPVLEDLARELQRRRDAAERAASPDGWASPPQLAPAQRTAGPPVRPTGWLALGQMLALYLVYGIGTLPLAVFISLLAERGWRQDWGTILGYGLPVALGTWPALLALSVGMKWLLIGHYREGSYPLWGGFYFRWWLVSKFQLIAGSGLLAGTPLLPVYFRLMGARVGRNCTLDTAACSSFDLIAIGDDSSIGAETQIHGYRIERGRLLIGRIEIGSRCFIGIHSALDLGARMGDESRLGDLSLLPAGEQLAAGEQRAGSPARPAEVRVPPGPTLRPSRRRRALFGLLHGVAMVFVGVLTLLTLIPSAQLLLSAASAGGASPLLAAVPAAGLLSLLTFCTMLVLVRRVLVPRAQVGVYPVHGALYLRKWAFDVLMDTSRALARPLYTTIYLPSWLRGLGARIGRRAEISTVTRISPELTVIGDQSFFADGSMIGGRRTHGGRIELGESRIGQRSFVGNSALLPTGSSLGDHCLLGCLSVPPARHATTPDGTEWLGSPSFLLPHRKKVEGFALSSTHEPTTALIAQRLCVDALRLLIPSSLWTAEVVLYTECAVRSYFVVPAVLWWLALPLAAVLIEVWSLLCVILVKRVLMGTFVPVIKPLWSPYVWFNEVVNGVYESVAAPTLALLLGTPFCAFWLRRLGCTIGHDVYLETTLFSEFDLVSIGDRAELNSGVVVQNHLFEDRIMKSSRLNIGARCSVGNMTVILYDTELGPGSTIGPLSLLMKGETLQPETAWLGIPTAALHPARPHAPSTLALPEPSALGRLPLPQVSKQLVS